MTEWFIDWLNHWMIDWLNHRMTERWPGVGWADAARGAYRSRLLPRVSTRRGWKSTSDVGCWTRPQCIGRRRTHARDCNGAGSDCNNSHRARPDGSKAEQQQELWQRYDTARWGGAISLSLYLFDAFHLIRPRCRNVALDVDCSACFILLGHITTV